MNEVTLILAKAKRDDVPGTELSGNETKLEQQTVTERLFLEAKCPNLVMHPRMVPQSCY